MSELSILGQPANNFDNVIVDNSIQFQDTQSVPNDTTNKIYTNPTDGSLFFEGQPVNMWEAGTDTLQPLPQYSNVLCNNLTCSGTLSSVAQLNVADSLIHLASGNTTGDIIDGGFTFTYNNGTSDLSAGFFRDANDKKFKIFEDSGQANISTATTINTSDATYKLADLDCGLVNGYDISVIDTDLTNLVNQFNADINQGVTTTDDVTFNSVTVTNPSTQRTLVTGVNASSDSCFLTTYSPGLASQYNPINIHYDATNGEIMDLTTNNFVNVNTYQTNINSGLQVNGSATTSSDLTVNGNISMKKTDLQIDNPGYRGVKMIDSTPGYGYEISTNIYNNLTNSDHNFGIGDFSMWRIIGDSVADTFNVNYNLTTLNNLTCNNNVLISGNLSVTGTTNIKQYIQVRPYEAGKEYRPTIPSIFTYCYPSTDSIYIGNSSGSSQTTGIYLNGVLKYSGISVTSGSGAILFTAGYPNLYNTNLSNGLISITLDNTNAGLYVTATLEMS